MRRPLWYRLEGHEPVPCSRDEAAACWQGPESRRVALTRWLPQEVEVSTVFLMLDHSLSPGERPILFETLVTGGTEDGYRQRYATWEEAERGHAGVVSMLRLTLGSTNEPR